MGQKSKFQKGFNILLSILIIIFLIIFGIRYNIFNFLSPGDDHEELPPRGQKIINTHEHINSEKLLNTFLKSQRLCNVSSIIMVGSPTTTFENHPKEPFIKYLENNEFIIKMSKKTNDEIIAFPTLNPNDSGNLERFKDYISRGARGLNLWTGHHGTLDGSWGKTTMYDWLGPLNRTNMYPIYEYCSENRIPIIWSVNLGVSEVREQFWQILEKFPDMIIKIPHFGVCFRDYNLPFIEEFLDKYNGGYTCFSWGHPTYVMEKFENISNGNRTEAIKQFFYKYQDRIMFGTDMVVTDHPLITFEWMHKFTHAYIDILEKDSYHIDIQHFTYTGKDFIVDYRGLNLSQRILDKIYYNNSIKFLNGMKWNESIDNISNSTLWEFDGINFKMLKEISTESSGLVVMAYSMRTRNNKRFYYW